MAGPGIGAVPRRGTLFPDHRERGPPTITQSVGRDVFMANFMK